MAFVPLGQLLMCQRLLLKWRQILDKDGEPRDFALNNSKALSVLFDSILLINSRNESCFETAIIF